MDILTQAYIADRKGEFDYSDLLIDGEFDFFLEEFELVYREVDHLNGVEVNVRRM